MRSVSRAEPIETQQVFEAPFKRFWGFYLSTQNQLESNYFGFVFLDPPQQVPRDWLEKCPPIDWSQSK